MSICRNVFNSSDLARRSSPARAMFGRLRWRSNAIRVALDRQGRIGMRVSGSALALLAAMTSGLAATPNRLQGAPAFSFYEWSGDVPGPGALLRSEPLPQDLTLENASKSERILYSSTNGLDDKMHIAVSGALFWPKGDPPAGGWPLVAWAHGTVGAAPKCAPSFMGRSERDKKYLNSWLSAGFAVVATDYQGLGTAGGHPFLATRPEAYGVLDSVRAVRGQPQIGDAAIVVGQSQGAGAAFATAAFQPSYAPDVKPLATVATGAPYFSKETLAALARSGADNRDKVTPTLDYTFLLLQLAELTTPGFDPKPYLTDSGRAVYDMGSESCLGATEDAIEKGQISGKVGFAKAIAPVVQSLFPLISYPTLQLRQPLFVGTREADHDVPPAMQGALVSDACAAGSPRRGAVTPDSTTAAP
jgi:pimeloyl-ACP methyl ester carboxylesterase